MSISGGPNAKIPITSKPPVSILETLNKTTQIYDILVKGRTQTNKKIIMVPIKSMTIMAVIG